VQEEGKEIIAIARKVFGHNSARDNNNARGLMTMRGWCRESGGLGAMRGNNSWDRNVRWMLEISASMGLNRVSLPSRLLVCSKYSSSIVVPANSV
jgi:hypothetical protein